MYVISCVCFVCLYDFDSLGEVHKMQTMMTVMVLMMMVMLLIYFGSSAPCPPNWFAPDRFWLVGSGLLLVGSCWLVPGLLLVGSGCFLFDC